MAEIEAMCGTRKWSASRITFKSRTDGIVVTALPRKPDMHGTQRFNSTGAFDHLDPTPFYRNVLDCAGHV